MRKTINYALTSCLVVCFSFEAESKPFTKYHNGLGETVDSISGKKDFVGIGPVLYELPPEKTSEQLLEEKYDQKHAGSGIVAQLFEQRKLIASLQQTGNAYPLPAEASVNFTDLERSFQRSLQSYLQIGNMEMVSNLQNRLGILYVENKSYEKAIPSFQQALSNKEELKDFISQSVICHNLGLLYHFMDNVELSYVYYDRMNKLAKKANNVLGEVTSLEQLAILKARKGQYREAEQDMIKKVLPLYKRIKDARGRIGAYNNLAAIYLAEEKYTESRWFHLQAVKIASIGGNNSEGLSYSLYQLGKIKKILKEYTLAISDYTSAASYAKQSGDEWLSMHIYDDLGDIYIQTKDYVNASTYLEAYEKIKNKLVKANGEEKITENLKVGPDLLFCDNLL